MESGSRLIYTFFSVFSCVGVSTVSPSFLSFLCFFLCFFSTPLSPAGVAGAEDTGVRYLLRSASLSSELLESRFLWNKQTHWHCFVVQLPTVLEKNEISTSSSCLYTGWPFSRQCEFPWWFAALLCGIRHVKCYSYHARTSVTVSGGVGMQLCMIRNHIFNI